MTRKMLDCRTVPSESGCTLAISGEPDELLPIAVHHAVTTHGHEDAPELRDALRDALADDTPTTQGAFVQLVEFETDQPDECDAIASRWAEAIGQERTTRWSIVGADRDMSGHYIAMVEFPDHAAAMKNSEHPATGKFMDEMSSVCIVPPTFRNLDVRSAFAY